jgi:hypothetical protein
MIWIALDVPPRWAWLVIAGIFTLLSVVVFRFSFSAYHRRYFFDKALKLAFWRTAGWLILNGGAFWIIFWLISLAFPARGWLPYLVGCGVWWLLSETLLAAGLRILDRLLENW